GQHTSQDNALWLNRLRILMKDSDGRAARDPSNPASDRLIQSIVNDGMEKGWLRQTKRLGQPGTEQIWIVPETQQGSDAATSKAFAALSEAADTGGPQLDEQLKYRRTQEIIDCWKRRYIYCPKPIRDLLFQAIEEIVNEGEAGVTVARLTSMARQRAESSCKSFGYWQSATEGVANALVASRVLLTAEGIPVPSGVDCWGSRVARLTDSFRDRCEAFMLFFAIKTLKDVNFYRDRIHLAHALLRRVRPESRSTN
ncbi:MAG: hypothetical protein WBE37_22965, partial [Bryobacteraceae bacterium]